MASNGDNRTIKTKAINLSSIIFLIYVLILPVFNKAIDYQESVILFGVPFFFFLSLLTKTKANLVRPTKLNLIFQIILTFLFLLSTLLSINPGSSYYAFFTFLTVLLIFNLSSLYIDDLELFYKYLIAFSCLYAAILIGSKLHLFNISVQPASDNFILQVWGHSDLADLLVFPVIITISKIRPKNILTSVPLSLFLILALILTDSRSAIVAVIFGIIFLIPKNIYQKTIRLVAFICLVISLIYIFRQSTTPSVSNLKTLTGSRPGYWQEAAIGFQKSPIFGNGPATFNIIDQQLHLDSGSNSKYAHNSILEYLTDNGLIFASVFFIYIFLGLYHQHQKNNLLFCLGLVSLIDSMFTPSWSSPGILIISLILIFHDQHFFSVIPNNRHRSVPIFLSILSILVFIFFLSKTSSDYLFLNGSYNLSLKLDPFNLNSLLNTIDTNNLSTALKLYPDNKVIFYQTLINKYSLPTSETYYYQLITIDPNNSLNIFLDLGYYYLRSKSYNQVEHFFDFILNHYPPEKISYPNNIKISELFRQYAIIQWNENHQSSAILLFQKAVAYSPEGGIYHIDLADAYWYLNLHDQFKYQLETICPSYQSPQIECQKYLTSINQGIIPQKPGEYETPH